MHRVLSGLALAMAVILGSTTPTAAQASLTENDIQRLQLAISDARADVDRLGSSNSQLSSDLRTELDNLSDEAIYLKVKLRKERNVPRADYLDLRDRIDDVRVRATGDRTVRSSDRNGRPADGYSRSQSSDSAIPIGTELDVRLQDRLSSRDNVVEDRFRATTAVDLTMGDRMLIPAGSEVRGVVSSVDKAGRLDRKAQMTLSFDQITIDGRDYPIQGTVVEAIEGEGIKGDIGKIGAGAGVGAIIGGILGGVKGAMAGILIGGGGIAAATPGKDVELPPGTILRVRLDQPPAIR
jgi:type II secretory pathway pseudopilin PulG